MTLTAIPGPAGDRLTGTLHDFSRDPLRFLTEAARSYGDVVQISTRNVLLADPGDIETMLVDRSGSFSKRRTDGTDVGMRGQGFPHAMLNAEGEDWRHKRDRLQPAFSRKLLATTADLVATEADRMVAGWQADRPLDLQRDVSRLTLRVVTRLLFGASFTDAEVAVVGRLVSGVMDLSTSPIRLPEWLPTLRVLRIRRALRALDRVLAKTAAAPVARDLDEAPALARLLAADPPLSFEELRDELATLVMAGYETTNDTVVWASVLLATHPPIAERVATEADAAADRSGLARLEALPYTHAVVREAMRLYPAVWITSRDTTTEVEFGGFRIPPGTTVTVSQWVTHRDERWFPDPLTFRPERWLPGTTAPPRGAYFPFGLGARACIGASIGLTEAVLIVSETWRRWRLELTDPDAVRPRPAIALQPTGAGMLLRAR